MFGLHASSTDCPGPRPTCGPQATRPGGDPVSHRSTATVRTPNQPNRRSDLPPLRHLVLVFAGGCIGALARVGFATALPTLPGTLPVTTLATNVGGAFLLAVLFSATSRRVVSEPTARLVLGAGVLGSFTTYSAVAVEVDGLLRGGGTTLGFGYAALTLALGLLAAWAGLLVGRALSRPTPGHHP